MSLTCPYCEHENEVPEECHNTCYVYETECNDCKKIFGFEVNYDPVYIERELNCKNGEPHEFYMRRHYRNGIEHGYCKYCDKDKCNQIEIQDLPSEDFVLKEAAG